MRISDDPPRNPNQSSAPRVIDYNRLMPGKIKKNASCDTMGDESRRHDPHVSTMLGRRHKKRFVGNIWMKIVCFWTRC